MSTSVVARPSRVDPAPLALGGFAASTFLLSWVNVGLIDESALGVVIATAWVFGGVIQILAAMWHFHNGQLFPAITFASYGAFWVSFSFLGTFYLGGVPVSLRGAATALFLTPWVIFTIYMLIGSLRTNVALLIAFVLVEATLIPLIIGDATGTASAVRVGGWCGLALALEVWYIAAAEVLNHQYGHTVLPVGPFKAAQTVETSAVPAPPVGLPSDPRAPNTVIRQTENR